MFKKLLLISALSFSVSSFAVNIGDTFDTTTQKPVISNLQEGSVYKSDKNNYVLVDKEQRIKNVFNMTTAKACPDMFQTIKNGDLFSDLSQKNEKQMTGTEKSNNIKHLFYCSDGVLVDVRIP